ncbi:zinc metallopeptidase [Granulimonas faecalis]|uniref:zinc metallopeptidase n=1 Tax=Granulimonas faecalis TaxID=2894155 RepID=UPI00203F83C4
MPLYYPMGFDSGYLLLVVVSLVLGFATQHYIDSTYKRWSRVPVPDGRTGASIARSMLEADGVGGVGIEVVPGELTDHFDPRDNSLHLSQANLSGASVASAAVACHEAGHAVQYDKGYVPGRIRTALVPVVNLASNVWMIVLIVGISMSFAGLVDLAIILFAASVLFQLVTLPVEFDASRRALAYLRTAGFDGEVVAGARKVLTAAALTYVAAALVSCLQLLYLLGVSNRRD